MTVFFPLYCLSEMLSPEVEGRVNSGAGLPIVGNTLVDMGVSGSTDGLRWEPARVGTVAPSQETGSLPMDLLHGERPREILLDHAPVQVVEEGVDVLRARPAVVDP